MLIYIYKLVCKDKEYDKIYIGATKHLNNRRATHKDRTINPNDKRYNNDLYVYIRKTGGIENWEMEIIEEYEALDNIDQCIREQHHINKYEKEIGKDNMLNMYKAYRTEKQRLLYEKEYKKIRNSRKVYCEYCECNLAFSSMEYHKKKSNKHKLNLLDKIHKLQAEYSGIIN